jgi:hypothetical protein
MPENDVKTRPLRVFRCGAVQAPIWVDHRVIDDAVVKIYSIRITKSYREGDEWKSTTTFATEDLPKVALVATEAYRFLRLRSEEPAARVDGRRTAGDADVNAGTEDHPTGQRTSPPQQGQGPEKESLL